MNQNVSLNQPTKIGFTDAGATYFKTQLDNNTTMTGIRFGVKDSGCNAKKYVINLTDAKHGDDIIFNDHGMDIFVNKKDLLYLTGTQIDYVKEGINKMVKFNNPNVSTQCGCGESFDIK